MIHTQLTEKKVQLIQNVTLSKSQQNNYVNTVQSVPRTRYNIQQNTLSFSQTQS